MSTAADDLILRGPEPGDLGWIVHRHGKVYAEELGWGAEFEGLVAEIVAGYARTATPNHDQCWIAERGGQMVGCVFVVRVDANTAQLRLFFVEPGARGCGVGTALLDRAILFARDAGYQILTLWTNADLEAARRAYQRAGFRLVARGREQKAGLDFEGQVWELALSARVDRAAGGREAPSLSNNARRT